MTKLILVADHSKTMRKAIQMTLQSPETQFVEAADGQTALLLAREKKPSLIIAEDALPGMDGYTLLSAIKHESALSSIPFVILRSKGKPFDAVRGVGAEGHLEKPFLPDTLLEMESKSQKARKAVPAEEEIVIEIDAEAPEDDDSMAIVLDFELPASGIAGPIPARTPSTPSIPVLSSRELEKKSTGSQNAIEESVPKKKETVFMSSFAPPSSVVSPAASPFAAPGAPAKPAIPVTPAKPAIPVVPAAPGAPAKPAIPVVPAAPGAPAKPAIPVVPAAPGAPAKPAIPVVPAAPGAPPAKPAVPVVPAAPGAPAKPAIPVVPSVSLDSKPIAKAAVPPEMPGVPAQSSVTTESKPNVITAQIPSGLESTVSNIVEKTVSAVSTTNAEHAAIAGLSRDIIERIAWEVIPPLAEAIIKEYLQQHPEWIKK